MSKQKTQPCPECGGEMRYEKHADEVSYLGHKRTLKTLGWWCSKCGEAILEGAALRAWRGRVPSHEAPCGRHAPWRPRAPAACESFRRA